MMILTMCSSRHHCFQHGLLFTSHPSATDSPLKYTEKSSLFATRKRVVRESWLYKTMRNRNQTGSMIEKTSNRLDGLNRAGNVIAQLFRCCSLFFVDEKLHRTCIQNDHCTIEPASTRSDRSIPPKSPL